MSLIFLCPYPLKTVLAPQNSFSSPSNSLHSQPVSSLWISCENSLATQRNPWTTANQFLYENPQQTPWRQQKSQLPSLVYRSSPVFCFQCQLTAIPYSQPRYTISPAQSLHSMAHSTLVRFHAAHAASQLVQVLCTSLFRKENTLQHWGRGSFLDPVFISPQGLFQLF